SSSSKASLAWNSRVATAIPWSRSGIAFSACWIDFAALPEHRTTKQHSSSISSSHEWYCFGSRLFSLSAAFEYHRQNISLVPGLFWFSLADKYREGSSRR